MNSKTLLLAAIALAVLMMAFIGISAATDGDTLPVLTMFMTGATPILTAVAVLMKSGQMDKTLTVSESTDQKVDQLLNGSLQTKVARLERDVALIQVSAARNAQRIGNIETAMMEILTEIRESRSVRLDDQPHPGTDQIHHQ